MLALSRADPAFQAAILADREARIRGPESPQDEPAVIDDRNIQAGAGGSPEAPDSRPATFQEVRPDRYVRVSPPPEVLRGYENRKQR